MTKNYLSEQDQTTPNLESYPVFQIYRMGNNVGLTFDFSSIKPFFRSCNNFTFLSESSLKIFLRNSKSFNNSIEQAFQYCMLQLGRTFIDTFSIEISDNCKKYIVYSAQQDVSGDIVQCRLLGFSDAIATSERFQSLFKSPIVQNNHNLLTKREIEVISLIADGETTKEIASKLHLSFHTVESHKQKLFKKLSVKNTAQLGKLAERFGYTSDMRTLAHSA